MRSGTRPAQRAARFLSVVAVSGALLLGLLPLSPRPARAAPASEATAPSADSSPSANEQARQHFLRGVAFYKELSFDAALAEFEKAHELRPDYRVLYNIGQVQAERHDFGAAIQALRRYLKDGGAEIDPARRQAVDQALREHGARVAQVTITASPPAGEVLVDGVSVASLPLPEPLLVNAGIREITVRNGAQTAQPRRLTLAGGDVVRLEFRIDGGPTSGGVASAVGAAPPLAGTGLSASRPAAVESPIRTRVLVTFAAAAGLAGATTVFALLARQANRDLDADLAQFPGNAGQISDDKSRLKTRAALTDAFGATTLLAAGLGVYFALSRATPTESETKRASAAGVRLVPAGTGVVLVGTF